MDNVEIDSLSWLLHECAPAGWTASRKPSWCSRVGLPFPVCNPGSSAVRLAAMELILDIPCRPVMDCKVPISSIERSSVAAIFQWPEHHFYQEAVGTVAPRESVIDGSLAFWDWLLYMQIQNSCMLNLKGRLGLESWKARFASLPHSYPASSRS